MKTRLFSLNVTRTNASDYYQGYGDSSYSENYLFASREDAEAFAMGIDTNAEYHNECLLFVGDLNEDEILETSGMEEMDDFMEALREPYSTDSNVKNYGEDEKTAVAEYIQEEFNNSMEEIPCANYDFDTSIEGSIIVVWSWERYVGYARTFHELRVAGNGDTKKMLAKEDKTFAIQVDVVMTKEEVDACDDLQAELTDRLLLDSWRWTSTSAIEREIESL